MPQVLEKLNSKTILWILGGILAVGIFLLCLLLITGGSEQAAPETTAPANSTLEKSPYKPQDFVLTEDGFMTCHAADTQLGIDVSGFQGSIDWEQVKNAGVDFVFIRVGGRGTTEGGLYSDDQAQSYYEGAKQAGLAVGAYFFSQAITPKEAQEEAWFVLELVKDWKLDLPVVYDWEWVSDDSRTAEMTGQLLTHCTQVFCQTVENAGLTPMIYFNYNQGLELLDLEQLSDYPFWLALYEPSVNFPYRVDFWQYSCTGSVPGIQGDVDLNLCLKPFTE